MIAIESEQLILEGGAQILTLTFASGAAGNISIQNAGSIELSGTGINANQEQSPSGLFAQVREDASGKGGTIDINTTRLAIADGAQISSAARSQGEGGEIRINATESVNISGTAPNPTLLEGESGVFVGTSGIFVSAQPNSQKNAGDIQLSSPDLTVETGGQITANTFGSGSGGNLTLNVERLKVRSGGLIRAGTLGTGDGGQLTVNASESVIVSGSGTIGDIPVNSTLFTAAEGTGDAGKLVINSNSLLVSDGGEINASTFALGNSEGIAITTGSLQLKDDATITASTLGQGNAGQITIDATEELILDSSRIEAFTESTGSAGDIIINTSQLAISDEATINASTSGLGNAGDINLFAPEGITLSAGDILSTVEATGLGNSGDITLNTSTLVMDKGAIINASTLGQGNAGNIKIIASEQVSLADTSFNNRLNRDVGGILAFTLKTGKAGDITIETGNLTTANGASIEAFTQGTGDAGTITLNAPEFINIDRDSSLTVETSNAGKAGNIIITTDTLTIGENAELSATATETATNTEGGGSITLNASNLNISGELGIFAETAGEAPAGTLTLQPNHNKPDLNINFTANGFISASTSGNGAGGDIKLSAPETINLSGQGKIAVETSAGGNAGNITITAQNLKVSEGTEITASTTSSGAAGDIILRIGDNLILTDSAITASTSPESTGDGGSIDIDPVVVDLTNSSIAVDSQGTGTGGDIKLVSETLNLDNSEITAETQSTDGGNIDLDLQGILNFANDSSISATAGLAQSSGNGGNVEINADFIIANPTANKHQITAQAFEGNGGNIKITTNAIFGSQFLRISASSERGVDGIVVTNTPDVDPSRGLIELESKVVDASQLIAENVCQEGGDSEFTVTGRGGLPSNPNQLLETDLTQADWLDVNPGLAGGESKPVVTPESSPESEAPPARGWVLTDSGKVTLVSYDPTQVLLKRNTRRIQCQPK